MFAPDGPLAGWERFELRPQQIKMAAAVKAAFENKHHLIVEAGTGVGKSFAYLVPAVERALNKEGKSLISTYTINLQEQLINNDIPFLIKKLGAVFSAAIAKGRNNYLCRRRLEFAIGKSRGLFDDFYGELINLRQWADNSEDGSLSELKHSPSAMVWDAVKSEHGNCPGRKCLNFSKCFYWRARRRLETADIIVANHSILFSDLVLRRENISLLPDYKFIVIDEAHNMEAVAQDHFGLDISNFSISYTLNNIYNQRTKRGFLSWLPVNAEKAVGQIKICEKAAKTFFQDVSQWYDSDCRSSGNGRCRANFVKDCISEQFRELRSRLSAMAKQFQDTDEQFEFNRHIDRCREIESGIRTFLTQPKDDCVYWVEKQENRRMHISLRSAPLDVGPYVRECLLEEFPAIVMTSATLSSAEQDGREGFGFFADRIGLKDFKHLRLGSPFNYAGQVTLYIESNLPEPNEDGFVRIAAEKIKYYLTQTGGNAFVLLTSYAMLKSLTEILEDWLVQNDMPVFKQSDSYDRTKLLNEFRHTRRAVLFGTDSFWQGVDVPGDALQNVIIVRLPFAVPNHPLIQGRIEKIRADGESPFFKYQLPCAVLKFKQGFGRLIRSKTDRGIVVVLDSRIVRKTYGRQFINAIPKCRIEIV